MGLDANTANRVNTEGREERGTPSTPTAGAQAAAGLMRIEEVSKRTGLSKRTLRYYEDLGLLRPTQRSDSNYRMYRIEDVTALERIKAMRDLLGLGLSEIREMVEYELEREQARRQYREDEAPASRLDAITQAERVTSEQLRLIEARMNALDEMSQSLRERLARYERLRGELQARVARPSNGENRGE